MTEKVSPRVVWSIVATADSRVCRDFDGNVDERDVPRFD